MDVLLVDDSKMNRMFLNALLDDYSEANSDVTFDSVEVVNGKEAVEHVSSKKYDLIFMDIMMPVMDGIEATKQIRKSDKEVVILAISASESDEHKSKILDSGAEEYISKPIEVDIFYKHLDHYIGIINAKNRCPTDQVS